MISGTRDDENLVESLAAEFAARRRRGEFPSIAEYAERHPELADQIRAFFPALALVEELKPGSDDVTGSFGGAVLSGAGSPPERLGDFRILREIGRGGMGVVYQAEQESLGRCVALKVLGTPTLLDPQKLRRFHREARAAANLHHTNIVPVFGLGEEKGLHYYVMQFIPGLSLDEVLDELKRLRARDDRWRIDGAARFSGPELSATECGPIALDGSIPLRRGCRAGRGRATRRDGLGSSDCIDQGYLVLGHPAGGVRPLGGHRLGSPLLPERGADRGPDRRRPGLRPPAGDLAPRHQAVEPAPRCPGHGLDRGFRPGQGDR
jgi:hypothetical protein